MEVIHSNTWRKSDITWIKSPFCFFMLNDSSKCDMITKKLPEKDDNRLPSTGGNDFLNHWLTRKDALKYSPSREAYCVSSRRKCILSYTLNPKSEFVREIVLLFIALGAPSNVSNVTFVVHRNKPHPEKRKNSHVSFACCKCDDSGDSPGSQCEEHFISLLLYNLLNT